MATKKKANAKKKVKAPSIVKVTMARLGSDLQTYAMPKGSSVKEVLQIAGINGSTTTVRLNGKVVTNLSTKLQRDSEIVAIAEIDQGALW